MLVVLLVVLYVLGVLNYHQVEGFGLLLLLGTLVEGLAGSVKSILLTRTALINLKARVVGLI